MRTKEQAILEDFILPNYDKRKKEYNAIKALYEINPKLLNVELLTEYTLNKMFDCDVSDGVHTDAVSKDGKVLYEWKTATVQELPIPKKNCVSNSHHMTIYHCATHSGVSKKGNMGVVIHNKVVDRIEYMAIPKGHIPNLLNSRGTKQTNKCIHGTYNSAYDSYSSKMVNYYHTDVQSFKQAMLVLK